MYAIKNSKCDFFSLQSDENVNLKLLGETISKTLKIYEKKDLWFGYHATDGTPLVQGTHQEYLDYFPLSWDIYSTRNMKKVGLQTPTMS